jgi:hypothetical protein
MLWPGLFQFHARDGFGGAQGDAGDPPQGERQAIAQRGKSSISSNSVILLLAALFFPGAVNSPDFVAS